jgi:GMP synthase (glutamine-hydrolysing)
VFEVAPPVFDALHWHGDTYELPRGARRLAGSTRYEQQAFVIGRAYALQFHLEVPAALAAERAAVPAYAASLERLWGDRGTALLDQLRAAQPQTLALARRLFGRWLELVAGGEQSR